MSMNLTRNDYRKLALVTFKYAPIITAFIMLIHVAVLLCGVTLGVAEALCGMAILPIIVTYFLSKGLGFCSMHRIFIYYIGFIFLCMQWK